MASSVPIVNAIENGSPGSILSSVYSTIEVRSQLSPPVVIETQALVDGATGPSTGPSWFTKLLKPTVILRGPGGGQQVIAPYGVSHDGTFVAVLTVAGLVGLGFLLGRLSKS